MVWESVHKVPVFRHKGVHMSIKSLFLDASKHDKLMLAQQDKRIGE
jgi:hypothetical protein